MQHIILHHVLITPVCLRSMSVKAAGINSVLTLAENQSDSVENNPDLHHNE